MEELIERLRRNEIVAATRVMAFMSFNPSIGRVLEKESVKKFEKMAVTYSRRLKHIHSRKQFDSFHDQWINYFQHRIRTNKGNWCSYGQAQKAINVFLKLFVDWAKYPTPSVANRIVQYLHVPLDKVLMSNIAIYYEDWYSINIKPYRHNSQPYSLSTLDKRTYNKWQGLFRDLYPVKPLLFDILWALER